MNIYINSNDEIKKIYNNDNDDSLVEINIDRKEVFGDMSDFMILNYCYSLKDGGRYIYPARNYEILKLLDTQIINKISILEQENQTLKEEISQIQVLIASLVSAISEK